MGLFSGLRSQGIEKAFVASPAVIKSVAAALLAHKLVADRTVRTKPTENPVIRKPIGLLGASLCAAGASIFSTTAYATELNFSFVGFTGPYEVEANWTQSSSPVPLSFNPGVSTDVPANGSDVVLYQGLPVAGGVIADASFFNAASRGGFIDGSVIQTFGPQVYTGPESAPVFSPGVFDYVGYGFLTVTAVPSVPEPAGWAMMLVGFGAIGFVSRRRRNESVSYG